MMRDFYHIAVKLVPLGSRPSVIGLRRDIATTIEKIVRESIDAYRNENLPADILRIETEVKRNHAESNRRLAALEAERSEFKKIIAGHLELLTTIEKWIEWCERNRNQNCRPT